MLTAGTLRKWLEKVPDHVEVHTLDFGNIPRSVKHVHLCTFKDGSGEEMVIMTAMGSHIQDDILNVIHGVAR